MTGNDYIEEWVVQRSIQSEVDFSEDWSTQSSRGKRYSVVLRGK